MITLILRSTIVYCIVLFAVRIMGKRQIGDMQPFELVVTLIIEDLACVPISDNTIPIIFGVVPLLTLVATHYLFTFLNRKSIFFRKMLNGKPVIVITPNGIDYIALKKLNMTLNDLTEGLRGNQCFNLDSVAYAIVETNGNISILLKSQFQPATNQDMKIKTDASDLDVMLINDGKLLEENILYLGLNQQFIKEIIKMENIKKIKDILILSANSSGKIYIQEKNKNCKILNINMENNTK